MATSDAELAKRALAGSQDAFRELVLRYQRPLYTLILRMVRDPALAEELAQDSFVKAFSRLSGYNPERKLSSWLFKIAHNTAIDHLRRRELVTLPLETADDDRPDLMATLADEGSESPDRGVKRADMARALETAIGRLRPEYREVVVLRFQEELAYDEIADVTGWPLGTVKTHLHRARKELALSLAELGFGPETNPARGS